MKSDEDAEGGLSLGLGLADPSEGVEEAERRGKRSPATEIEFEFASGRDECTAEAEVEVETTGVFALGIPKQKEKQRVVAVKRKTRGKGTEKTKPTDRIDLYLLGFRIKIFVINSPKRVYSLNYNTKEKREKKKKRAQAHRKSLRRGSRAPRCFASPSAQGRHVGMTCRHPSELALHGNSKSRDGDHALSPERPGINR